jgi:stearoyl-CoA desaturase (Delta-9 desaturase)
MESADPRFNPRYYKTRGVFQPVARARTRERRIALIVVVVPFLGMLGGIALLWRTGVGPIDLLLLLGMFTFSILGIGVGYHRHFSHRAFQTTKTVKIILAILGSSAAQGPVLYWAALHRRHHTFSDRLGDPHSPHLHGEGVRNFFRGFWHAHTGWLFAPEIHDWALYVPDLIKDRAIFRINRLYFLWVFLGLVIPTVLGALLTGTWQGAAEALLWGGLVRISLTHHTTWSVNSICHIYGTRTFRSRDLSTNNVWLAIPSFGESWHNNHHAFPRSAFHGLSWWQIDLSGYVIRFLQAVGVAWDVKAPSKVKMQGALIVE